MAKEIFDDDWSSAPAFLINQQTPATKCEVCKQPGTIDIPIDPITSAHPTCANVVRSQVSDNQVLDERKAAYQKGTFKGNEFFFSYADLYLGITQSEIQAMTKQELDTLMNSLFKVSYSSVDSRSVVVVILAIVTSVLWGMCSINLGADSDFRGIAVFLSIALPVFLAFFCRGIMKRKRFLEYCRNYLLAEGIKPGEDMETK